MWGIKYKMKPHISPVHCLAAINPSCFWFPDFQLTFTDHKSAHFRNMPVLQFFCTFLISSCTFRFSVQDFLKASTLPWDNTGFENRRKGSGVSCTPRVKSPGISSALEGPNWWQTISAKSNFPSAGEDLSTDLMRAGVEFGKLCRKCVHVYRQNKPLMKLFHALCSPPLSKSINRAIRLKHDGTETAPRSYFAEDQRAAEGLLFHVWLLSKSESPSQIVQRLSRSKSGQASGSLRCPY